MRQDYAKRRVKTLQNHILPRRLIFLQINQFSKNNTLATLQFYLICICSQIFHALHFCSHYNTQFCKITKKSIIKTINTFYLKVLVYCRNKRFLHSFFVVKLCVENSTLTASKYFVSRGTNTENIWLKSSRFIKFKNVFGYYGKSFC